jgi:hypothetical protein
MYDQSQDEIPVVKMSKIWMTHLGVDSDVQDAWKIATYMPYSTKMKGHLFSAKGTAPPQLETGSTKTTFMNSMNNICVYMAWAMAITETATQMTFSHYMSTQIKPKPDLHASIIMQSALTGTASLEKVAQNLGFTLKCKSFEEGDMQQATFLKGMWFRGAEASSRNGSDYVWLPLPSTTIKIGKLLKSPNVLAPRDPDPISTCARMIANSYPYVPRNYPILGPFLEKMKYLNQIEGPEPNQPFIVPLMTLNHCEFVPVGGKQEYIKYTTKVFDGSFFNQPVADPNFEQGSKRNNQRDFIAKQWLTESYQKPIASPVYTPILVDEEDMYFQIAKRYNVSYETLLETNDLIRSVESFPCYLQSEMFRILQKTDYA